MKKVFALAVVILSINVSCSISSSYDELTKEEKKIFVRVEDLRQFGSLIPSTSMDAKISKMKVLNGITLLGGLVDYEYEFEYYDEKKNLTLYIYNSIRKLNFISAAGMSYYGDLLDRFDFRKKGVTLKELPVFYKPCKKSSSSVILYENSPVGNLIRFNDGTIVYTLIISGFYFDDAKVWNNFFKSKVESMHAVFNK